VIDLGDTGAGSGLQGDLRYAINTANGNDEPSNQIEFAPGLNGTITLTQGLLTVTKSLEIHGPGASLLTVSGNHHSGVFDIVSGADPQTVSLSDLTIADGTGVLVAPNLTVGGGLLNNGSVVTLTRLIVTGSSATDGGGIDNLGTMVLDSCAITNNQALANGAEAGGIDNARTMTLTGTTVSGNSAPQAAGILNRSTMSFSGGTIADNFASQTDGAILNLNQMSVIDSTISGNGAGSARGGVENVAGARMKLVGCMIADNTNGGITNDSQMLIKGCTIVGNTSAQGGGGLAAGLSTVVFDSTIVGNSAPFGGGVALTELDGRLEIIASTITGNSAQGTNAGGISRGRIGNQRLLLDNTIVAENTDDAGPADVQGAVTSLGYNLIGAADGSTGWVSTDQTGTADAPLDPMLGPLQDNGGFTLTRAPLSGSPAINTGDPALAFSRDQRGSVRQAHAIRADIGAVEPEPIATFRIMAPSQVVAGEPFSFTVIALDGQGNTATTYPAGSIGGSGSVHFTSSDAAAQLPGDYRFTAADQGVHMFTAVLATPGQQTIRVVDTGASFNYFGATTVTVVDAAARSEAPAAAEQVSSWGVAANGWGIWDSLAWGHKDHNLWWA
jgi:hypothetical protein